MNNFFSLLKSKKTYKILCFAVVSCLVFANVILIFMPVNRNNVLLFNEGNFTEKSTVLINDTVSLKQNFVTNDENININSVSFKIGTFQKKLDIGKLYCEIYEANSNSLVSKGEAELSSIRDNKYFQLDFKEVTLVKNHEYFIKLFTKDCSVEDSVAVYSYGESSEYNYAFNGDSALDTNLDYKILYTYKTYNFSICVIINLILILVLLIYLCAFSSIKTELKAIITAIPICIIIVLCITSYLNYHKITLDSVISLIIPSNNEQHIQIENEKIYNKQVSSKEHRNDGSIISINSLLNIVNINTPIKTINIGIDNNTRKLEYLFTVYYDIGNGLNDNDRVEIPFVYTGQENLVISLPTDKTINDIRIDSGVSKHMERLSLDEKAVQIDSVEINNTADILNQNNKIRTILIFFSLVMLFVFIIVFIWYKFKIDEKISALFKKFKINLVVVFIILATIFGGIMSFAMPIFQAPDEYVHLKMAYENIGCDKDFDQIVDKAKDFGSNNLEGETGKKIEANKYTSSKTIKLDDNKFDFNGYISPKILARPGQTIGIVVCQFLNLPVMWILAIAELLGLAVYIIICAFALKIMPFKKNIMMLFMLLPMCMQQAGSFSYDGMANAISFLIIAYILYLKFTKSKITKRDFLILFVLGIVILLTKLIYILLLLLIFIVPLDKLELKFGKLVINKTFITRHKKFIPFIILGCIIFFILALIVVSFTSYGQYIEMLTSYVSQPLETLRIVITTTVVDIKMYIQTAIASFGWADTVGDMWFVAFTVIMVCMISFVKNDNLGGFSKSYKLSAKNSIFIYFVFVLLYIVVLFTMISWTVEVFAIKSPENTVPLEIINKIVGVQGRYFLPFLPLLFITIKSFISSKYIKPNSLAVIYYPISIVYSLFIIIQRYWII